MEKGGPATPAPHVGPKRRKPFCKPPTVGAEFLSHTLRSPPPPDPKALPSLPRSAPSLSSSLPQQPAFSFAGGAQLTPPPGDFGPARHWTWASGRRRSVVSTPESGKWLCAGVCGAAFLGGAGRSGGWVLFPAAGVRVAHRREAYPFPGLLSDRPSVISCSCRSGGGKGAAGRLTYLLHQPRSFLTFKIILAFIKHFSVGRRKDACHTEADEIWTYRGTHGCLFWWFGEVRCFEKQKERFGCKYFCCYMWDK